MPYASAEDGTELYYEVNGAGEGLLVLLGGQANDRHWWDAVRPGFDARFTTLTLDYRGTGRSGRPQDLSSYSTRQFADDVLRVLDAAGARRVHLYGTSMGGRVAQWVAAEHPERTGRLVLGCTTPGAPHGVERGPEVRRSLAQADPAAARQALLELMYSPSWLAAHPGPYNTLGDASMPPHARRGHLRASARHDSWDALPRIASPTLVLHGTDDAFNPAANAPLLAGRIPDARLRLLQGARHAYFEECRTEATRLVLDFLSAEEDTSARDPR